MSDQSVARAAASLIEIVRDIEPDQLGARTPCAEYDVRKLINHLLFWGPSLEGAARKEAVPPPAAAETDADLTGGDWRAAVEAHAERLAAAWGRPEAWQGVTHMGGPTELPASLVGGMVVGELLVHSWDLAQATGRPTTWDDGLVAYTLEELAKSVEQGRKMGVYGPEVPVPASAPPLDRVLALTGRDPAWTG
ncbi:TIGR03086 family protein [Microtetraspora sp. NBRC 13810]|uniref:TIGR03086 family metal-binding protein n=1 Tax=Microtetraspora sp. NBRC 13810 TaxID=3030990 RepID=UPI0024A38515|nr:TIGR03086 family metal-binding protein [Microtetraspora sp. NBRC 13810]GLW07634.1 TIGR03086 family protein [Microtetraspora sp. NBRC 13810]